MKVAIIGAGISGLLSLKNGLEENLDAVCYELTDHVGGLWSPHEPVYGLSTAYEGLITNSSKEMMAFSDHLFPASYPSYLTRDMMYQYILSYCERFGLYDMIRLQHKVHSINKTEDHEETGCWNVTVEDLDNNVGPTIIRYDGVILCSGLNGYPYTPDFPGIKKFKGRIIHSHGYKGSKDFGPHEKVLVLGNASSGLDMATDIAMSRSSINLTHHNTESTNGNIAQETCSDPVYLSARSGVVIGQRNYARPVDLFWTLFLAFVVWLLGKRLTGMLELAAYRKVKKSSKKDYQKYDFPEIAEETGAAICDDIWPCLVNGTVKPVPAIAQFKEHSVVLSDGQEILVDAVLMGTGYEVKLPMVTKDIVDPDNWDLYRLVWPVHLEKNTLALVGFVRINGQVPPVTELQARWVVSVFSGKVKLPSNETMKAKTTIFAKTKKRLARKLHVYVTPYCSEIASYIGCQPKGLILESPYRFYKSIFGPAFPYIYRQVGPGKRRDAWRNIVTAKSRYHPFKEIVE
ncbi:flavin-containing monooxygenase 5-like [Watersipora subatra]|uniref:flavin-containing monooxygenase 5-like n=1 Tax=Watersipora subatra TaxID=2589382 RepID=UPI00355C6C84